MKHKLTTLLLLAIITYPAFAQVGIKAQKTIGGSSTDYLTSIFLTKDGGLIAGGFSFSDSSGEKTENNRDTTRSTADYWVVKFDKKGNIQWDKTIGGTGSDALRTLEQTNDGGYILGGNSSSDSSGDKTENNRASPELFTSDYWIVKLDSLETFNGIEPSEVLNMRSSRACNKREMEGIFLAGIPNQIIQEKKQKTVEVSMIPGWLN